MNWQLARYLIGSGIATLADRLAQIQLLSIIVMAGPDGQGLGSNTLALLLPSVLFAYVFGTFIDKNDQRKFLISTTLLRGIFLLTLPTVLTMTGATGPTIPLSIFILSSFIAADVITNFAIIPKLVTASIQLRRTNAFVLIMNGAITLFVILQAPSLADYWLPHESMRLCAALYFAAMCSFWAIDRSKTKPAVITSNDMKELAEFFQTKTGAISLFRLGFFTHVGHLIFYALFLVFSLQNTQLSNAQSVSLYTSAAVGFCVGGLLSLTFFNNFKASSVLALGTLIQALNCVIFAASGNSNLALKIFLFLAGTTGATTIIAIDTLLQKKMSANVRAKIYGAIVCLSAGAYTIAAVGVEQIATQYAAVTIFRATAAGWLAYATVVALGSNALRRKMFKPKMKALEKQASKTASTVGNK
ncbi:MAG TPA: MFS transporter [Drouetiella sp.]